MGIEDANLTDLVAELRERLRSFISVLPVEPAAAAPGPLGPAGRAALAARLLAVILGGREGIAALEAAAAFSDLAETLASTADPLPSSAMDDGLRQLATGFEALALACEQQEGGDLADAWRTVRERGDHVWPAAAAAVSASATAPAPARAAAPAAEPPASPQTAVWLIVGGDLRRAMLRHRLEDAGLRVLSLGDIEGIVDRLAAEPPAALICDDAAPHRFATRVRSLLPRLSPPLILVRGRRDLADAGQTVWLPPFRAEDLLARIGV